MENPMKSKDAKGKALDVMIAIGTKRGLGMKGEEGKDYKEPATPEEDMKEDMNEEEVEDTCSKCGHDVTCSDCGNKPSECTC
jgi:hypothetical protein